MNPYESHKIPKPPRADRSIEEIAALLHYPSELPIVEKREEIIRAVKDHQVVVITGETGSGKSTQIPKMCMEAGRGAERLIGCTQPRRIAAITLANRVADELGETGSRWVGYKIRFQDRTGRSTRIKFMTDGILLAEAQRDRLFKAYDTIIIDEAHERTLNIDFLLGLIKQILPRRPDLKVIITSATIDPEKFSRAFDDAPMIEVSGRTYPVDVWYRPPEPSDDEDGGDATYVDQAMAAVHELKSRSVGGRRGDILIFMPTESDIRETVQRLEEKRYPRTLVFPLFGRLAAADQQRIFRLTSEEKIVVSTNVAETSVTIPGIGYVIDTGLARISQYNAKSRTQGLPVVSIARASADQRKGRCGRVAAGICVRLYSQEDYLARPLYTSPEIQRSNLAEVILRMLFLKLGSIQDFPFLDPPSPAAIKDGFGVLQELGAVDDHRKITSLGKMMARLPLDPRLARMLLEAQKEGALRELTILAAALSVQDPRERPMDQEARADQVHAVFRDPRSDFVTLLKIWQASWGGKSGIQMNLPVPDGTNQKASNPEVSPSCPECQSRGQLRRFCKDHFISYRRVREWRDIHEEIRNLLDEMGGFELNTVPAGYEAIHRCILSGYLSHIALRKEKNMYLGTRNRQVMLFPGSGLFNKGPGWLVAAELVQTSRLYARTAASIDPEWLEELGKHLCRSTYFEPHWEKKRGQVVAFERVTLYGLTIVDNRKIDYSRIHPEEARQIFIRSALVEGELPVQYGFMEHNRRLIRQIEELESKTRRRDLLVDDEALFGFYDRRVPNIADLRTFNKFLKDQGGDASLRATKADLLQSEPDFGTLVQFPDTLAVDDVELPLRYAFHPGEDDDGVTVTVPVHTLPRLSQEPFDWLVPGMLPEKITVLLKALPKSVRRLLVPVGDTAQRLLESLPFREGSLYAQLSRCVHEALGVRVPVDQWDWKELPNHLIMRFQIVGPDGAVLGAGRSLADLKPLAGERHDDHLWEAARKAWEREGIASWDFGDLPQRVDLGKDTLGLERYGYPGLTIEEQTGTAALRLFEDPAAARRASRDGLMVLYRSAFAVELKQLKKTWAFPENMTSMLFFTGSRKEANLRLHDYILREAFDLHTPQQPDRRKYQETVENLKRRLAALGLEMAGEVFDVIRDRDAVSSSIQRFRKMARDNPVVLHRLDLLQKELENLVPRDFPLHCRRLRVQQLPRYLKGLAIRVERMYAAPEKDRLKAEQLDPFIERHEELIQTLTEPPDEEALGFLDEYRCMIEEFKISLFAPEIKTLRRVSAKRMEEKWQEWLLWKQNRG